MVRASEESWVSPSLGSPGARRHWCGERIIETASGGCADLVFTHLTTVPSIVPANKGKPSLPSDASQTLHMASLCLLPRVMCPYPIPPWYPVCRTT